MQRPRTHRNLTAIFATLCAVIASGFTLADEQQPEKKPAASAKNAEGTQQVSLDKQQDLLRRRFLQFEQALQTMAQYMEKTDPKRAALIRQAIDRSYSDRIEDRMKNVVDLLQSGKLGDLADANEAQRDLVARLRSLLLLLQSENRKDEIESEKERIKQLIKELGKLINREKILRAETERGGDPAKLAAVQRQIAEATQRLLDKIKAQDAAKNGEKTSTDGKPQDGKPQDGKPQDGKPQDGKPQDGKPQDGKPQDGKPQDGKPQDGKPQDGKPQDGKPQDGKPQNGKPMDGKPQDGKPQDGKPQNGKPQDGKPQDGKPQDGKPQDGKPKDGKPMDGKPQDGKPQDGKPQDGKPQDGKPQDGKPQDGKPQDGKPQDGKPQDGKPQDGKPQDGQPQDQQDQDRNTPGRKQIEEARKAMERAIEELKKNNRDAASREEDKAIRDLDEARAKLEEILRQLREEEKELFLLALQARFEKMLRVEREIKEGTESLAAVDKQQWNARHADQARRLTALQEQNAVEASKAMNLLKEEGSSIAFPEAVRGIRQDMHSVAGWLAKSDVGELTQDTEQEIIDALEEMLEALKRELEKQKEKQQQQQQQQQQQNQKQEPPLVDILAELKMLRTLQHRINRRTTRLGRMIRGEQATTGDGEVVNQLKQLAKRQSRVQKAAYDLATGKNQ